MSKKAVAIIPARGGSKRIPGKNIKEFAGKPIISYSIENAKNANCFDEIMVSTDNSSIREISLKYGAVSPFVRSTQNSDDHSTIGDVVQEVLLEYRKSEKYFEYFCCILPTAPLASTELIREAFQIMQDTNADSVIPVTRFDYPIQRSMRINERGQLKMFWPENYNARSQDLEPAYHDAGQFYWMKSDVLLEKLKFFTDNSIPFVIPQSNVQDIDTLDDWALAELKYKFLKSRS